MADPIDEQHDATAGPGREAGWGDPRRLLHGPLRLLVAGQSLGQAADGAAQIAFAQVVLFEVGKGATPATIAGVLAATLLPFSLIGPFAGVVVDRWDRRRVLVGVSVVRVVIALLAIGVVMTNSEPAAYAGVILLLSSSRFVLAAKGAALPRTVAADELVAANTVSSVVGMSAAFVGAVAASTFVSAAPAAAFVAAAVLYALAAGAFARLPAVGGGETHEELGVGLRRVGRELAEGVRAIAGDPRVRDPLLAVWLHRLLLGGGFILLVLVADQRYHFEASGYGLGARVDRRRGVRRHDCRARSSRRHRAEALLPLSFFLAGMAAVVGGADPQLGVLVAGVGVAGFAFQLLKVLVDALLGRAAPDSVRGRVFAAYDVVYNLAFVLAGLALVPLWEAGREQALLWGLAAAFFVGGLAFARWAHTWPFLAAPAPRVEPRRRRARVGGPRSVPGPYRCCASPSPRCGGSRGSRLSRSCFSCHASPTRREAGVVGWWGGTGFMLAMHHWLVPNLGPFILPAGVALGVLWLPWGLVTWSALADGTSTARRAASCAAHRAERVDRDRGGPVVGAARRAVGLARREPMEPSADAGARRTRRRLAGELPVGRGERRDRARDHRRSITAARALRSSPSRSLLPARSGPGCGPGRRERRRPRSRSCSRG